MIRFTDFWKISLLAVAIILGAPVFGYMGNARGQELTPGGVPINTTIGTYFDRGGGIKGNWGYNVVVGLGYFEFLVAPPASYVGRVPPVTGILIFHLPNHEVDQLTVAQALSAGYHMPPNWADKWKPPTFTSGGLPQTLPGGTLPLGVDMLKKGKMWDINLDGHIDMLDVEKFNTDMDQDGIANNLDRDADGDGEVDWVEAQGAEPDADSYRRYDPAKFPDRDGDSLPDWGDKDGDGYNNYIEKLWAKAYGEDHLAGILENVHPDGYGWLVNNIPESFGYQHPVMEGVTNPWGDDDGDGAWNWLEIAAGTDYAGAGAATKFPDGNGDGVWDWGAGQPNQDPNAGAIRIPGGITQVPQTPVTNPTAPGGGGSPPAAPTPPAPTPESPFQIAWPQAAGTSKPKAGASAGAVLTSSNSTTDGAYAGIPSGASASNPGAGGSYTPSPAGTGAGTGGGTGDEEGEGNGNYRVIEEPKGQSTAWKGVSGGSWQMRSGNDTAATARSEFGHVGVNASALRNAMGIAPTGVDSSHSVAFTIKWIDGTNKVFNIPLLPDLSTQAGRTADQIRIFIRIFAAILAFYIFLGKVWALLTGS